MIASAFQNSCPKADSPTEKCGMDTESPPEKCDPFTQSPTKKCCIHTESPTRKCSLYTESATSFCVTLMQTPPSGAARTHLLAPHLPVPPVLQSVLLYTDRPDTALPLPHHRFAGSCVPHIPYTGWRRWKS